MERRHFSQIRVQKPVNKKKLRRLAVVFSASFAENSTINTSIAEVATVFLGGKKPIGFEGKLNSSKYAKFCKCSPDTALRDITDLMDKNMLEKDGSCGRSTGYVLVKGY